MVALAAFVHAPAPPASHPTHHLPATVPDAACAALCRLLLCPSRAVSSRAVAAGAPASLVSSLLLSSCASFSTSSSLHFSSSPSAFKPAAARWAAVGLQAAASSSPAGRGARLSCGGLSALASVLESHSANVGLVDLCVRAAGTMTGASGAPTGKEEETANGRRRMWLRWRAYAQRCVPQRSGSRQGMRRRWGRGFDAGREIYNDVLLFLWPQFQR